MALAWGLLTLFLGVRAGPLASCGVDACKLLACGNDTYGKDEVESVLS